MKKALKIILYIILAIVLLLAGVFATINTPWGKERIRAYLEDFLNEKLDTKVQIGKLGFSIPNAVNLGDVLVLDRAQDTLLWVHELDVHIAMLKLISGEIVVNRLHLADADVHMYRTATDTNYNYQFIIDAFASAPEDSAVVVQAEDTASSAPIKLDVGLVHLSNTRYRLSDTIGGILFGIRVNELNLKPRNIDLEQLRFEVEQLHIDWVNSYLYTQASKLPESPEDTSSTDVSLIIDDLQLTKASFAMKDEESQMDFGITAKEIAAAMPWFSLSEQRIDIEYFNLIQSNTAMSFGPTRNLAPAKPEEVVAAVNDSTGWKLRVGSLLLKGIGFAYDDNTQAPKKDGIDYAHLDVRNLHLNASDLYYSIDTISGIVKNLTLMERSGLDIQTMRTVFTYHNRGAILDELYLKTPNTLIQDKMAVSYRSLDALSDDLGKTRLDLAIKQSVIGFDDLFIFLPEEQKKQLRSYRNQRIKLNLIAAGYVDALNINRLFIEGLTQTAIDLNGMVYGLPDADKLRYELAIRNLRSSNKDIAAFLPASVKQQVNVPAWFALHGQLKGTTTRYQPNLQIYTADGDAALNGVLDVSKTGKESYDLFVRTNGLNLGKILRMEDQLGRVSMNGLVKGVGFDPKTMDAQLDATVAEAFLNGYNYRDFTANGYMKGKMGELELKSRDPNAFMTMKTYIDMQQQYPALTSVLNVEYINLKELKLLEDDVVFTGDVEMDVPVLNVDYPVADVVVSNPFLTVNGTTYVLDSIYLFSRPEGNNQDIELSLGNIVKAKLSGHVPVTKMGDVLLAHVNKYYRINDQRYEQPLEFDMNLNGTITYHRLFRQMLPDLKPFEPITFSALADPRSLNVGLSAPGIRYGDMRFDTLGFSAVELDSSLVYALTLNKFTQGNIAFYNSALYGQVQDNALSSYLSLTDAAGDEQFSLGATARQDSTGNTVVSMAPGLKLNKVPWSVDPDNRIVLGSQGIFFDNLVMTGDNQSISVHSPEAVPNSPFNILIKNFRLANLTSMISQDTLLADGILNVNGNIDLSQDYARIKAHTFIDSLSVMGALMGRLGGSIESVSASSYKANIGLNGAGNQLDIDGYYHTEAKNGNELDLTANVGSLAMTTIEGLSFGALKKSEGTLWGNLSINGTLSNPLIDGQLTAKDVQTTLSAFNTFMRIVDEQLVFVPNTGIRFSNFKIEDRFKRQATLNGDLLTKNFTEFALKLRFNASRWEVMNSTNRDNESIYGRMLVSANLGLTGELTAPEIDGNLTIHDSTDFNYAFIDNPELVSNEGIVEFYDSKVIQNLAEYDMQMERAQYLLSRSSSLNVNVDIEKDAKFTVLIDPETGDKLSVNGTAFLNANLGPDGSMALAGTYELDGGYYDLNIEVIKKQFKIQKGSIIQLAGDPLDAEANITAVYEAQAAPLDLLQNQLTDNEVANMYRQRMPFQVLLKMSGPVMKPNISFDIQVAEGGMKIVGEEVQRAVDMKLNEMRNNPSEMNKQVVAVLALGRFISEDPFNSSSGYGVEYAVRQSASRFLSEQLNRMAGKLVAGIELDLGLNTVEDYSTGSKINRTDLNVTASKRLFNDRVKVTVGNDFQLEGQVANQNPSYLPGNISTDYMITPDGKYVVRGYRKTELQNIVRGYIIETGMSFRLGLEYNRFRQLLMGQKRYREYMLRKRREQNEQQEQRPGEVKVGMLSEQNRKRISENVQTEE